MEKIILDYYKDYGIYVNKYKMFPNIRDGLLPVQRRTLLGAYSIAKSKFVKTVKVIGEVIGKWHPHAEQVGTIEWAVQNGFLEGDGWWGSKLGSQPSNCAAPRYTSVKLSKFTQDVALKFVNYVNWEPDELDPEPVAFPTLLPFALMTKYVQSFIGFGRKTTIPIFDKQELVNRIFDKTKIIKPKLIGAECISSDKECLDLLTQSKDQTRYKISFRLKYCTDPKTFSLYVISSPEFKLATLLRKFGTLWSNGDIGYVEIPVPNNVKQKLKCTNDETVCFKFTPAKQKNFQKIFDKMVDIIKKIKFDIYFEIVVYDPDIDNFRQISVDEFLDSSYNFFKETYKRFLSDEILRLEKQILEFNIIRAIQPHLGKFMDSRAYFETKIKELAKLTKFKCEEIESVVSKYRIKTLLTIGTDTKSLKQEINELTKKQKYLESEIKNMYNQFL